MFWTSVCPIHNMSSFLQFSYHLGLPLAIVHWKATIWRNCSLLKSYIKLYSTQNGYGHVCVPYTTWLEAHEGECYHWTSSCYSKCFSQLKYQISKFWLKTSVLYEQLWNSVPYTTLCLIHTGMFMFLCSFVFSKINFFLLI